MDLDSRVYQCERDIKEIVDRLGKVEDKASGAWNTIREINGRMDKIETKVDSLEVDVKAIKATQDEANKKLKWIIRALVVFGVILLTVGLIELKNGSDIPAKVVETVLPLLK